MFSRGKFALFFAAAVLAVTVLWAETPMTQLKVVVKTQTGRPIDHAEVIVQWHANAKHPRSSFSKNVSTKFELRSNQEGEATMPPIPKGNIRVQINAKGYQTFGDTDRKSTRLN